MIDPDSGVEAFVKPCASDRPYKEYAVPSGSLLCVDGWNTGYIEAVTDERYCLGVTLPRNFHTISNAAVRMTFTLHISDLECIKISEVRSVAGLVTSTLTFDMNTFHATYPGCVGYRACGFRFVDRGYSISEHEDTDDLMTRSRIDVEVVCGQLKLEHLPRPIQLSDRAWETPTTEILALDLGRSHTVDLINLGEVKNLPLAHSLVLTEACVAPATRFTFYYVSHEFLKKENIIPSNQPRTRPSPNSNTQLSMQNFLDRFKRQPKRKASKIDFCDIEQDDDEGPPPLGRIKVEAEEDDRDVLLSEPPSRNSMRDVSPATSMHSSPAHGEGDSFLVANMARGASHPNTSLAIRSEKAKKKAKLMLELQELENEAAQIKIKKRLLDLQDNRSE